MANQMSKFNVVWDLEVRKTTRELKILRIAKLAAQTNRLPLAEKLLAMVD